MLTWFGNRKTATKLMIGFVFTGAIMAGLAGIGLNTAGVMRDNIENVNNVQLKPLMMLTELRGLVHQVRSWVLQAVLTRDQADRQQALAKIEEIKGKTDELRKNFEQSIVTPAVKKGYEEFVVALGEYREVREGQVLKLVLAGKQDEALVVMKGEGARKYKAVVESINNLIEVKKQIAQDKYENSLATFMTARTVMIASCVGGIVLGLLFGSLVARMVARNLADVVAAAQALGEGKLSARSRVTTRDEVGTMASAFNQMGDALQKASNEQQTMMQEAKAQAASIKGLTNAISKAQAVIEFNLDGTVITANENFQHTLGYGLEEITGRHHRMFCDPAYVNSGEYQAFWQKLNRGEFDAGVYPRRRKDGKDIWIQASYNPILDQAGKVVKITKFATDITAQKVAAMESEGILKAVDRGQAVIEFNMDGTVRSANSLFLGAVGYSVEEIKGQHHRMFCDPAYANSGEYQAFWQKLNRGEFDAGVYRRVGKGGKELWIQATYNPIFDLTGKPYKVVKFATDITGQKQAAAAMEHLVTEAQAVLGRLAENDLTQEMAGTYAGELEKVKRSINAVVQNLAQTIRTVREAVESVTSGSEEIAKGNEDLSQRTSEQASALEETSASMEEMTSTVKQNADNAKQANQLAANAREIADKGGTVTKRAVDAMGEINKSSSKIADIITVIDEIAFQTNLLALNAAVEAARAGEHGRGFAVVAAEVRNLAQRSATAAKEIKGLINESIQRVTDGSELVNQSGKTLEDIVSAVKRVSDIIAEISAASNEQASGIDQVNKAIMSMDETTQQNAALVEETTSAAQSMKEQAKELMRQVSAFKISGGDGSAPIRGSSLGARPAGVAAAKSVVKKPGATKGMPHPEPVAVGGRPTQPGHDEFEEF